MIFFFKKKVLLSLMDSIKFPSGFVGGGSGGDGVE